MRFAVFAGFASMTGGCALIAGLSTDYSASSGPAASGGSTGSDASGGLDSATPGDATDATPVTDAGSQSSGPTGDGGCGPLVVVDDTFAAGIGAGWTASGAAPSASGGATPHVLLVPATAFLYGTLFHAPVSGSGATFSASFRFRVDATATIVGDGLAFVWLDGSGDTANSTYGDGFGVVTGRRGWAFVFDAYQNTDIKDPRTPYYGIIALDATRPPGSYDWHLKSGPQLVSSIFGVVHVARVTSVSSRATVAIDGNVVLTDVPIAAAQSTSWTFGLTAATGGSSPLSAYVDDVRVTVPNPACPVPFP